MLPLNRGIAGLLEIRTLRKLVVSANRINDRVGNYHNYRYHSTLIHSTLLTMIGR
jgi:hypothetical protein